MPIPLNGKRVDMLKLEAELTEAGVAFNALGINDAGLHTYTAGGAATDLPAGAATVLAAHVSPTPPTAPTFGSGLDTDRQFNANAATAVANLQAFIDNGSPSNAQVIAVVRLLCRVALFYIRRTFNPNGG